MPDPDPETFAVPADDPQLQITMAWPAPRPYRLHHELAEQLQALQPTDCRRDLSTVQVAAGLALVAAYGQDLREPPTLHAAARRARRAHRGLYGTTCRTP